ncbi:NADH dehydrogenase subunit G [Malonomonas rubra DSM 5091]|uniref:NADH dehydrogenase subunit G n=1 Tax=Malonomonas rubra DSM 5091 TaxID=1122189 RepID=A0A1M6FMS5_MALRU|nr:NADH-quinone oxidoreductase subunit NuoG [Malonomonas rubra]SHI98909.1 NADH dehydrogenase subunit G [Malonomonas rubra DSM 5091]
MPTLTIDNQQVTVPDGTTVLEAAEQLGIVIPHFCYHKALGAVGACRMCAVTVVEGTFKGLKMSCLVKAEEGMVVTTDDQQSVEFRARVSEWLMLNHPHDCPVCDEGGECQLQEMTIASGHGLRRYTGKKRTYNNQQLGPFIAQEMNRCIQCYRCVRTYKDYCGGKDFGVMGSRNRVFFGRFKDGTLESDFSGNIVDACPTGVFTDKTYRFKSRYWDLQEAPSICPHCSLGCSTVPGGRYGELQRVRSSVNEKVNGFFICDRGRFGSSYVNHPERPRQATRGSWKLTVDEALQQLDVKARELINQHGPESVLLLGSNRASLETNWLLQRWAEEIGCRAPLLSAHLPRHQAAQVAAFDLADRLCSLEKVRQSDLVVAIGADPLAEAPMLGVALRQAVRSGGKVKVFDPRPVELPCDFEKQTVSPTELLDLLDGTSVESKQLVDLLRGAERPVLVAGGLMLGAGGMLRLKKIAAAASNDQRNCLVHPLLGGANSFGAALLSLPEQDDLLTRLESERIKMLVCVETDPLLEAPDNERFAKALSLLEELVVLDYLPTPLSVHANLFIPTTAPVESEGTFINNEGRQQLFAPVIKPRLPISVTGEGNHPPREFIDVAPGSDPIPSWQLFQQLLGEATDLPTLREKMKTAVPRLIDFETLQPGGVSCRVAHVDERCIYTDEIPAAPEESLQLVVTPARYGSDLLSRYSAKLQPRFTEACVQLHPQDAAARGLQDGAKVVLDTVEGPFNLTLKCNDKMAIGCALVENGPKFQQLVPGGKLSFCKVHAGMSHG